MKTSTASIPFQPDPPDQSLSTSVARYTIHASPNIPISLTLPFAEQARRVLLRVCRRIKLKHPHAPTRHYIPTPYPPSHTPTSPPPSGKDASPPRFEACKHAYFLPTDENGDGFIDHLTVYVPSGLRFLDSAAVPAVEQFSSFIFQPRSMPTLGNYSFEHPMPPGQSPPRANRPSTGFNAPGHVPVRLKLVGLGASDDFRSCPFGGDNAAEWVSATPFIATRFPKKRGKKKDPPGLVNDPVRFLEQNLVEELGRMSAKRMQAVDSKALTPDWLLPRNCSITPLVNHSNQFFIDTRSWAFSSLRRIFPVITFQRLRYKYGDNGNCRLVGAFLIRFEKPLRGPLALGFHSHFGMGIFLPLLRLNDTSG